jgi:hypothetical protein
MGSSQTDSAATLATTARRSTSPVELVELAVGQVLREDVAVEALPTILGLLAILFGCRAALAFQEDDGHELVVLAAHPGDVDVALVDDWSGRLPGIEAGALRFYPLLLVVPRGHPAADPGLPVDLSRLRAERWLGGAARRAIPPRRRPAAGRGRRGVTRALGIRGPRHDPQPGGPWHRDRRPAAAGPGGGGATSRRSRAARHRASPRRLRSGEDLEHPPPVGGRHPVRHALRRHSPGRPPGPPRSPSRPTPPSRRSPSLVSALLVSVCWSPLHSIGSREPQARFLP